MSPMETNYELLTDKQPDRFLWSPMRHSNYYY